jgi:hypothetical protein
MSSSIRQALIIAAAGLVLLSAVAALTRRQLLSFRYAAGWAAIGVIAVLGAFLAWLVAPIARILGMTPTGLLLASVSVLLFSITLLLTIAVSRSQERIRDLSEALALAPIDGSWPSTTHPPNGPLVIVPAYNEQATVGSVVSDIRSCGYQVLVVDDGSSDGTAITARLAGAKVICLPMNQGVGGALRAGFKCAVARGYDSVVQCDADGQHLPEQISALITTAQRQPSDMVIGTRFGPSTQHYSVVQHRRSAMRVLAWLASRAAKTSITDATSGFRLIRQPLLGAFANDFPSHYLGDTFEALVAAGKAGYSISEVPVDMAQRQVGESSASFGSALRLTIRAAILVAGNSSYRLPLKKHEITVNDAQTI